jgi:putative nucleotidyltransferase with HDIG domain
MSDTVPALKARIAELERELNMYRQQSLLLAQDLRTLWGRDLGKQPQLAEVRSYFLQYVDGLNREYQSEKQRAEELNRVLMDSVGVLGNAIEARDAYTRGHTERVTRLALAIAMRLGWSDERLEQCRMGGLLHDVGKIGVPDAILQKPGRLTNEEYDIMKRHPRIGAQILAPITTLSFVVPYVLCHHERWDGKGYPDGLQGHAIPLEGRVLAIADAFDAMTSDRAYRKGMDRETAVAEVLKCSGSQFDPELVELFYDLYKEGVISEVLDSPRTFDYTL